jgi:hypothetical protein
MDIVYKAQGAGQGDGAAGVAQEDPPRDGRGGHPAHRPPQPPLPFPLPRQAPRRRAGRQERQARPLPRLRVPRHRPQEVHGRLPEGAQREAAPHPTRQGTVMIGARQLQKFSLFNLVAY